jgi:hypothetical protein
MTQQWLDIQTILRARGYGLGSSGPNRDGVDGSPGDLTAAAILAELSKSGGAAAARGLRDADAFFANLRQSGLFVGGLEQSQVDGLNFLTAAMAKAAWPLAWAGYGLGTAYHETARTMEPVKELGGPDYFRRLYDPQGEKPQLAARLGNTQAGDGALYCGRGYVQLTGRGNYRKGGAALGKALEANPELAREPAIAAEIMVRGMAAGWFSGARLSDLDPRDRPGTFEQFKAWRPIINGHDRDSDIANYALRFQAALIAGKWA